MKAFLLAMATVALGACTTVAPVQLAQKADPRRTSDEVSCMAECLDDGSETCDSCAVDCLESGGSARVAAQ